MLKKIDCVMIRVEDVKAAMAYYSDVFGLQPVWWDETSAGLRFPESDAEIVVHCNPDIPSRVEVHRKAEMTALVFTPSTAMTPWSSDWKAARRTWSSSGIPMCRSIVRLAGSMSSIWAASA